MGRPLPKRFYARPAKVVARALLGAHVCCNDKSGVIVETEAYVGPHDLASHTRFGKTKRNAVMFGPPGRSYVYLCYGVHEMFNVVTGQNGDGEAILIRALALESGHRAGAGPGKLTKLLGIDRTMNDAPLTGRGPITIREGSHPGRVASGPRIGVAYAGAWAKKPLRFWIAGHPSVSVRQPR